MTNVSFEFIKENCKHGAMGHEDGMGSDVIETCRHESNKPKGCSWGDCNKEVCPILKEKDTKKDSKINNNRDSKKAPF